MIKWKLNSARKSINYCIYFLFNKCYTIYLFNVYVFIYSNFIEKMLPLHYHFKTQVWISQQKIKNKNTNNNNAEPLSSYNVINHTLKILVEVLYFFRIAK